MLAASPCVTDARRRAADAGRRQRRCGVGHDQGPNAVLTHTDVMESALDGMPMSCRGRVRAPLIDASCGVRFRDAPARSSTAVPPTMTRLPSNQPCRSQRLAGSRSCNARGAQ